VTYGGYRWWGIVTSGGYRWWGIVTSGGYLWWGIVTSGGYRWWGIVKSEGVLLVGDIWIWFFTSSCCPAVWQCTYWGLRADPYERPVSFAVFPVTTPWPYLKPVWTLCTCWLFLDISGLQLHLMSSSNLWSFLYWLWGPTNSRFVLKIFSFVNCTDTYSSFHAHVLTLQKKKLDVRPQFRLKVVMSNG